MTDRLAGVFDGAAQRVRGVATPAVQAAVAAVVAWWLSSTFLHVPQNFFAPFAAIAVLLGGRGGRGPRALQVIFGGLVGVGVGELALLVLGPSAAALLVASAVAMLLVATVTIDALPLIHAGIGAAMVAIMNNPATGLGRFGSAVIGGLVALIGTQVVFTTSPVRLLSRPVTDVLARAADALAAAAAHDEPTDERSDALVAALPALASARAGARRVRRYTVRGRLRRAEIDELERGARAVSELALDVVAVQRVARRGELTPGAGAELGRLAERLRELAPRDGGSASQVPGPAPVREVADRIASLHPSA